MQKILLLAIICLFVLFFLFKCEKNKFLYKKTTGKESIDSILKKVEKPVAERLKSPLIQAGYAEIFPAEIIIAAFKEEEILEVYAKNQDEIKFIKAYPFTANSGKLGPKLREGDRQIPEGIYKIDYLNPNSSYYLSMKVSYPNDFDLSKSQFSEKSDLGGDIFIHGKAVTIGCIPIGDTAIEELFVLAQKAGNHEIKVIISPRDFRKNPTYPEIEAVDWEKELYDGIWRELSGSTLQDESK